MPQGAKAFGAFANQLLGADLGNRRAKLMAEQQRRKSQEVSNIFGAFDSELEMAATPEATLGVATRVRNRVRQSPLLDIGEKIQLANSLDEEMRTRTAARLQQRRNLSERNVLDEFGKPTFTRQGGLTFSKHEKYDTESGEPIKGSYFFKKEDDQTYRAAAASEAGQREREKSLDKLEQQKAALEAQLEADYGNTSFKTRVRDEKGNVKETDSPFSLDLMLSGEQTIPQVEKTLYDKATQESVKTGEFANDPRINKWVGLVAQHETAMKQAGRPFTPAKKLAREKTQATKPKSKFKVLSVE